MKASIILGLLALYFLVYVIIYTNRVISNNRFISRTNNTNNVFGEIHRRKLTIDKKYLIQNALTFVIHAFLTYCAYKYGWYLWKQ